MKKKTLVFLLAMLLIAALAFTGCAKDAANDGINDGVKDEQGLVGELEDDLDGDRDHDEKNDDKTGQDADKQNDKKQSGSKSEKVDDANRSSKLTDQAEGAARLCYFALHQHHSAISGRLSESAAAAGRTSG